jgi:hypothetical protein
MPGPDYPWATYLAGAEWRPRPGLHAIHAVVLHARDLSTPEMIAAMRDDHTLAYHYIALPNGAVIQMVPERGYTTHVGKTRQPTMADRYTIAIALDGEPGQATWPIDQVLAVARILSVTLSVRGVVPVRDAASICAPRGRLPEITSWPWVEMQRRILRLSTPIDRLFAAAAAGVDAPDVPGL